MTAVRLRAATAWAKTASEKLSASDPRFQHWVYAVHDEGTVMMYRSAFIVPYPDDPEYIAIFPEHHEFQVYAKEDFRGIWELQEVAETP